MKVAKNFHKIFLCSFLFVMSLPSYAEVQYQQYQKYKNVYMPLKIQYEWMNPKLFEILLKETNRHGLDISFVCALIQAESNGKAYAKNKKSGATGLMQVMPFHLPKYYRCCPDILKDPVINIKFGCAILKDCLKRARGNKVIALKNYNSGPNSKYYNWPYITDILTSYMVSFNL